MTAAAEGAAIERPLTDEESAELDVRFTAGLELIPLPPGASPGLGPAGEVVLSQGISALVDAVQSGADTSKLPPMTELATTLGVVFGDELCRVADWSWVYLRFPDESERGGLEGPAIVTPQRTHACMPVHMLYDALTGRGGDVGRLFEVLRGGRLPTAGPGAYQMIG